MPFRTLQPEGAINGFRPLSSDGLSPIAPVPTKKPNFSERLTADIKKRGENLSQIYSAEEQAKKSAIIDRGLATNIGPIPLITPGNLATGAQASGELWGGVVDVGKEVFTSISNMIPDAVKKAAVESIKGQPGVEILRGVVDLNSAFWQSEKGQSLVIKVGTILNEHPEAADTFNELLKSMEGIGTTASGVLLADQTAKAGNYVVNKAPVIADKITKGVDYAKVKGQELVDKSLAKDAIKNQLAEDSKLTGFKSKVDVKTLTLEQQAANDLAVKSGIPREDLDFYNSLSPKDKKIALEQIKLRESALTDTRARYSGKRPEDLVGENLAQRNVEIEKKGLEFAKDTNAQGKLLRGQKIDVGNSLVDNFTQDLDTSRVTIITDKTELSKNFVGKNGKVDVKAVVDSLAEHPNGVLDFSESTLVDSPNAQKVLQQTLDRMPTGIADAGDMHIYKNTVTRSMKGDFGANTGGSVGDVDGILAKTRHNTDTLLDGKFTNYDIANTRTRDFMKLKEDMQSIFGTSDITDTVKGGQIMRSAFSNNRNKVINFLKQTQEFADKYGLKFEGSLLDQAQMASQLEDLYGIQGANTLGGQMKKGIVEGGKEIISGIKNPVEGGAKLLEKVLSADLSLEAKRKALQALFNSFMK